MARSGRELDMALKLVDEMTEKWQPEAFKNTYRNDLMKRIEQKVKAGQTHTLTAARSRGHRTAGHGRRQGGRSHVAAASAASSRTAAARQRRRRRARQQAQTQRGAPAHQQSRAPRAAPDAWPTRASAQQATSRLKRYAQKRNFRKTAEPSHQARRAATPGKTLIFVVQKHAARRLHWDFRLEWQGTLRSWAVPKGPSLDPGRQAARRRSRRPPHRVREVRRRHSQGPVRRRARRHLGQRHLGAGRAISARALQKGHLEFELFGKKLAGRWHLVRTRMQGKQPSGCS